MKFKRTFSGIVIGAAIATIGVVGAASPAFAAEVTGGQYVSASSYVCGAQEVATGASLSLSGGVLRQRALVYRNCKSYSVNRKADIIFSPDGKCYSVPAGKARVLDALFVFGGRDTYRSAKAC